jgi:hypothetical protein
VARFEVHRMTAECGAWNAEVAGNFPDGFTGQEQGVYVGDPILFTD